MAKYDTIIKNGTVFDGLGNPPQKADIGIAGDEIKFVGDLQKETAKLVVDAAGKYIAPGFIDLTSHSDTHWTIFSNPSQESLIRQGITTIIGGNCGSSLAPFTGEATTEEIGRWTDVSEINVNWNTMGEFLKEMDKHKIGVNFGTLVGFNTIQHAVSGQQTEEITEKEINQARLLFKNALEDGAFGVSVNLALLHNNLKDEDVLAEFFKVAKKYNAVVKHHLEDEGENILPSLSTAINTANKAGAKLHLAHFKIVGKKSWNFISSAIAMIKNARADGHEITCDFFPYTKTGSSLVMLLPLWFRNMSNKERMDVLKSRDNSLKNDLIEYLKKITLHYENIIIASSGSMGHVGKTIEKLSQETGLAPEELILNILEINDCRVSIFNEVISGDNIEQIAGEEFSAVSSDGVGYSLPYENKRDLPHPRSFGAFPKALKIYAKEKNILPWEKIIYKMSGFPASIIGISDRGSIAKNKKADVVVFDPNEISDTATYDNPLQYAHGIHHVFINGDSVLFDKGFTGKLSGKILRKK